MILMIHDPFPHTGGDTLIVKIRRWLAFRCIRRQVLLYQVQKQQFIDVYGIKGKLIMDSDLST